ncbi:MAG: amidohydrolase family protein [Rikenellaceae bacterium]|nr:amidohydrolase family protein [Rikenellaceae bacterium]
MKRKISADLIIPIYGEPVRNGMVEFGEDGTVISVSENAEESDVEKFSGVLVPGFVNTHNHLELAYMEGVLPKHTGLPGFVKGIMEVKAEFPEEVQKKAISDADQYMWDSGVQAVGDISNTPVSFSIKKDSRIKYVTYLEIFDLLFDKDYSDIMREGLALYHKTQIYGIEAYITLHSTYNVSKKLFDAWAGMPHTEAASIHFMESAHDDTLFRKEGGFWEFFSDKGITIDYMEEQSSVNRVMKGIPSDRRVLLVHNTNATAEVVDMLKQYYPRLSWALCPCSNLYIENKLPPVDMFRSKGVNLTIGTDSLSSNTQLSMIAEMRAITNNFNVPLEEIIQWATFNGAKALELDDRIGSFAPGKTPGAVIIENVTEDFSLTGSSVSRRLI